MGKANISPRTFQEASENFADPDACVSFMAKLRWPDGVSCPVCEGQAVSFLSTRRMWKCKDKACQKHFSLKLGTVMEDSPISLKRWLQAIWLVANAKKGISSYELHRQLGITQKSAWFLLHRIKLAMQSGSFQQEPHSPRREFKNFQAFTRHLLSVPKKEVELHEEEEVKNNG